MAEIENNIWVLDKKLRISILIFQKLSKMSFL